MRLRPGMSGSLVIAGRFERFQAFLFLLVCVVLSVDYGVMVDSYWRGKTKVLGNRSAPLPLCVPEIFHGLKKWKYLSNQCSPITKGALFFEGIRFRLFVFLPRASCKWRWELSIYGMKMTRENESTRREACHQRNTLPIVLSDS